MKFPKVLTEPFPFTKHLPQRVANGSGILVVNVNNSQNDVLANS